MSEQEQLLYEKISQLQGERDSLQERYDCNTAIMHSRTKLMNQYRAERDALQKKLDEILRRQNLSNRSEA